MTARRPAHPSPSAPGPRRPRVLLALGNVVHGGAALTVLDIARAVRASFDPLLLSCDGRTLSLRDLSADAVARSGPEGRPLESRTLPRPVPWTTHLSPEYDAAVLGWCAKHRVALVHAHHFLLAGLGWCRGLRALGIPLVVSFHDFYTACPSMNFVDRDLRLRPDGVADGATEATVFRRWFRNVPVLDEAFSHAWKSRFDDLVFPFAAAFTAPCADARDRLLRNHPALRARAADFRIVPHGRDFASFDPPDPSAAPAAPARVLLPGGNWPTKGSDVLDAMAALDGGRTVVFHVAGNAPRFEGRDPPPGIVLHGPYERDRLPDLVRSIRPDLAAILSPLPETWCHALTECWAAGLPVLAFDVGAQGERLRTECPGGGWLLPLGAPPAEILRAIRAATADAEALRRPREAVAAWQRGPGPAGGSARMGAAYADIYRKLIRHEEPTA